MAATFKKISADAFSVLVDGVIIGTVRKTISYKAKTKDGRIVGNKQITMWRSVTVAGDVLEGVRSDRTGAASRLS